MDQFEDAPKLPDSGQAWGDWAHGAGAHGNMESLYQIVDFFTLVDL